MNNLRGLKQKLALVSRLQAQHEYDRALAEVESLRKLWPGNVHLHILWARLVQLQEEPTYTLDEARQALQQAIEMDKSSPAAAIELGYFLDNVQDDPEAASEVYVEAITAARKLLIDGLIGQAKARLQLGQREESLRCVLEVLHLTRFEAGATNCTGSHAEQIQELLNEMILDRSAS